jgi:glucose/arabinose dehydrogenase/mono/diheme cytochrome c family protein
LKAIGTTTATATAKAMAIRMTMTMPKMKTRAAILVIAVGFLAPALPAASQNFHNAPASAKKEKNPYAGHPSAAAEGAKFYAATCGSCHGPNGRGIANIPSLARGPVQSASDGEIFWFIGKGDINNGMPAWEQLPAQERWQLVTYIKSLPASNAPQATSDPYPAPVISDANAGPPPTPPFTDYRYEKPGAMRHITANDLPAPFATKSAGNGPELAPRPANAWPQAPAGFKVEQYVSGLDNPRLILTAPNGDFFVAESDPGDIKVFRGITSAGAPQQVEVFASGLKEPYGIAFYPPGPNPQWVYVGDTNAILRFPYQSGDLKARGAAEHIADVPAGGGHWTRDLVFSPDGKKMFVGVGSRSNVDDTDTHPGEKNRADILEFNPDGSGMQVYAYGIRNAGGGLAIDPKTGALWCSVNERDALGDNLVPDYITHVQEGGFYGWPWWYVGGHQDPRHQGKHPELKDKVIVPDVLLQPHNASLELTFYQGKQFPAEYRGDIFSAQHGSWNRGVRTGYEVVRVPLHQTGQANGEYEEFLTGFVVDNGHVWGRPVGVAVAPDGSLLVTDDGSNSIWRVSYVGK